MYICIWPTRGWSVACSIVSEVEGLECGCRLRSVFTFCAKSRLKSIHVVKKQRFGNAVYRHTLNECRVWLSVSWSGEQTRRIHIFHCLYQHYLTQTHAHFKKFTRRQQSIDCVLIILIDEQIQLKTQTVSSCVPSGHNIYIDFKYTFCASSAQ